MKDQKIDTKLDLGYMEEELYIKGNVVIWSKGLISNDFDHTRVTVCSYSSQFPIRHALWCTFHSERPILNASLSNIDSAEEKHNENPLPAVCIVDSQNIKVFTADNEDFISSVPFKIGKVWNTRFGILLEKENEGRWCFSFCFIH